MHRIGHTCRDNPILSEPIKVNIRMRYKRSMRNAPEVCPKSTFILGRSPQKKWD